MAEEGYAEKTLKEIKVTANQIMELALDNDVIFRNVFAKVEIPSIEAVERRALTQDEIDLITNTYAGHRMGMPVQLMLYCGIRRGELLALTWGTST
jgi:integrase